MMRRRVATFALALALPLAAAGCASADGSAGGTEGPEGAVEVSEAGTVAATDGWVKSVSADEMMTAVFVTLQNESEVDVHVTSAATNMSDAAELHKMVEVNGKTVMQEAENGLTIPAGESVKLEPGGLHVMVMGLSDDVVVGETYTVILTLDDGSEVDFDVIAKDFAGGNEEYEGHHAGHGG